TLASEMAQTDQRRLSWHRRLDRARGHAAARLGRAGLVRAGHPARRMDLRQCGSAALRHFRWASARPRPVALRDPHEHGGLVHTRGESENPTVVRDSTPNRVSCGHMFCTSQTTGVSGRGCRWYRYATLGSEAKTGRTPLSGDNDEPGEPGEDDKTSGDA